MPPSGMLSLMLYLLVLLSDVAVQVAEPVKLRYQFKKGEALVYSMDMGQAMEMTTSMVPEATQKVETRMAIELYQKVIGSASGSTTLEVGFNKFAADMTVGGQKTPLPGLEDLKKTRISLQMTDRGEMSDAKLLNKEELSEQSRRLAEAMKDSINQNSLVFPDQALAIGETWSIEREIPADIPGAPDLKMKVKSSYKLIGIEVVAGKRCAKVKAEVQLTLRGAGQQMGMPIQADLEGIGQGENLFALQEGRILSSAANLTIAGDLTATAQGQSITSHLKIGMTIGMKLKGI